MQKLLGLLLILLPVIAFAEGITAEGVNGSMDRQRRGPVVTVSTENGSNAVKILADAFVRETDLANLPLRFDFFVNRKLVSSQMRSEALPGPVGIDVGTDIATIPFNYQVVVTLLLPNRTFTSMIEGAVYGTDLSSTIPCTLSVKDGDTTTAYTLATASTSQTGENAFVLEIIDAKNSDATKTASAEGVVSISGTSLSSTLKINVDGEEVTVGTSGTVVKENDSLKEITLKSSDETYSVSCK